MKFLILILCFFNLAFASVPNLRHVIGLNPEYASGELVFFIDTFINTDRTKVFYRHQIITPESSVNIKFEKKAKTISLQFADKENELEKEQIDFIELQLKDGYTIFVRVLMNGNCEVISTHPLLQILKAKIVPCRYSRVQGRPGMSGGN